MTLFLEAHARPPKQIILDLDATDDPLHGHQEGRFFHGFYDCHCYLPLYVFCGRHLLLAKLRRADIDASAGSVEQIERIVRQIRTRSPALRIRSFSSFVGSLPEMRASFLASTCAENRGMRTKRSYIAGSRRTPYFRPSCETACLLIAIHLIEVGRCDDRYADAVEFVSALVQRIQSYSMTAAWQMQSLSSGSLGGAWPVSVRLRMACYGFRGQTTSNTKGTLDVEAD